MTEFPREKKCSVCKKIKLGECFHRYRTKLKNWYLLPACKDCANKRNYEWRKANPDKAKNNDIKKLYGITIEDFNNILSKQKNRCAICGTKTPKGKGTFHIDHDHKNGKIRGLLCHHCNIALGCFDDNIETMEKAIKYLNKHI